MKAISSHMMMLLAPDPLRFCEWGCANNTWMGCVRRRDQTKEDEKEQEEG